MAIKKVEKRSKIPLTNDKPNAIIKKHLTKRNGASSSIRRDCGKQALKNFEKVIDKLDRVCYTKQAVPQGSGAMDLEN